MVKICLDGLTMTNNKKSKLKKIKPPIKYEKIKFGDYLFRKFPKARITISNEYGQLILSEIALSLTAPQDWNNMKYFWEVLMPLLIPPSSVTEEPKPSKKKDKYIG